MAKTVKVGQVMKNKDGTGFYVKFNQDLVIKKGECMNLEDPKMAIKRLKKMIEDGKIDEDKANYIIEKLEKTPEFVKFEVNKKI